MPSKYRRVEYLAKLQRGTIIKHELDERTFVVTGNYGSHVTAVATIDITNPAEWLWFDDSENADNGGASRD